MTKIKLTEITGHSITTLGKTHTYVYVQDVKRSHPVYVIKDDERLEYDRILRVDFVKKNMMCYYRSRKVTIKKTSFKLFLY